MTIAGYLAGLVLAVAGFLLLCLSNPRHQRVMAGRQLAPRTATRLRQGGFCLIGAAFVAGWACLGMARGTVVLAGELTLAATIIVALLARKAAR
ncbi:DUF3325 domain-containing protein [Sphingomonas sp. ERG5]|uniref:DUF3325 domain-containing protein n=1 Tax=Sphingomonas sp. ERG5 TaxID=1381597 RepID=UPI00068BF635|nr:DUF3325 domain-containing protein [Sphingomonas sp. ERG5]